MSCQNHTIFSEVYVRWLLWNYTSQFWLENVCMSELYGSKREE